MKPRKKLRKWLTGIAAVILLFLLVLIVWNAVVFSGLGRFSETAFDFPGAGNSAFDLQAVAWDEPAQTFFFSGYMKNKTACPVYLVSPGKETRRVSLLQADGSPLVTHAGGIAIRGDYFYVADSLNECLCVFSRPEILSARDGEAIRSIGTFATATSPDDGIRPSFITAADGKMYVGEFHLPLLPVFSLRRNHHIGSSYAIMAAFPIDPSAPLGLAASPCEAYCLPEAVQGAVFDSSGRLFLSRCVFLFPSAIDACQPAVSGRMTLMGNEVPLYTLTKTGGVAFVPLSEQIELVDGKLYVATEACTYLPSWIYSMWDGQKCRTIDLSVFEAKP